MIWEAGSGVSELPWATSCHFVTNARFSVGEAYLEACGLSSAEEIEERQRVWRFNGPQRCGNTTWLAPHDRLVTRGIFLMNIIVMILSVWYVIKQWNLHSVHLGTVRKCVRCGGNLCIQKGGTILLVMSLSSGGFMIVFHRVLDGSQINLPSRIGTWFFYFVSMGFGTDKMLGYFLRMKWVVRVLSRE